jgi:hypothetical protein
VSKQHPHDRPRADAPRVAVSLNEEDMAALTAYFYRHTPSGRRRDRILKSMPLLVAVVWAYTVREHPEWGMQNPTRYALYLATGIPIIAGLGWLSLWYLRPNIARMSVQMGPRKRMLEPLTMVLEPEGIRLETKAGVGKAPWLGVRHVGKTDDHIFLLFTGPNGFIAPRRDFDNAEAFDAFAETAEHYRAAAKEGGKP